MQKLSEERIRSVLRLAIEDGVTAGANLLVLRNGEEILYLEDGLADCEQKKPIRRDTIFRLYSMSKPVTAAAAMILMEQGKLDLAEPVSVYLPEYAEQYVEKDGCFTRVREPMKVMHLLNMTSGLTYGGERPGPEQKTQKLLNECCRRMGTDGAMTTREFAGRLGAVPLLFEPGTWWNYSLSADVLGAVIEVASGMKFGEFLEKELFEPLGMKDTAFWVPQEKQSRLARVYSTAGHGKMKPYTGNHLAISHSMNCQPAFESGGAGLVSTIDDYARFAQMLQNGGSLDGIQILSRRTTDFFISGKLGRQEQRGFDANPGMNLPGHTYSHLMRVMEDPSQACIFGERGEYGWDGWLGCYFANLPQEKVTILMMQQKQDAGTIPLTRKIRNLICAQI